MAKLQATDRVTKHSNLHFSLSNPFSPPIKYNFPFKLFIKLPTYFKIFSLTLQFVNVLYEPVVLLRQLSANTRTWWVWSVTQDHLSPMSN